MKASILSKIGSIFKKKNSEPTSITNTVSGHADKIEVRNVPPITLPETSLTFAETSIDGHPHVCVLNTGLYGFAHKAVFRWHLVLTIKFDEADSKGMPESEEIVAMQDFFDILNEKLVIDPHHPNALLLGRVTGNGESRFMWYVNNPELANSCLQGLIDSKTNPIDFYFEMFEEPDWKEAAYWLAPLMDTNGI